MENVVHKFTSFAEAQGADKAYYRSLTPQQRLDVLLGILASQRSDDENSQRFVRVCRIVKRGGR
jgi:hypothetical protein